MLTLKRFSVDNPVNKRIFELVSFRFKCELLIQDALFGACGVCTTFLKLLPRFTNYCFDKLRRELHIFKLFFNKRLYLAHLDKRCFTSVPVALGAMIIGNLSTSGAELTLIFVPFGNISLTTFRAVEKTSQKPAVYSTTHQEVAVFCQYILTSIEDLFGNDRSMVSHLTLTVPAYPAVVEGVVEDCVYDTMPQTCPCSRNYVPISKPVLDFNDGVAACRIKLKELFDNRRSFGIRLAGFSLSITTYAKIADWRRGRLPTLSELLHKSITSALTIHIRLPFRDTCENVCDKARTLGNIPLKYRDHLDTFSFNLFPGVAKVGNIARKSIYFVDNQRIYLELIDLSKKFLKCLSLGSATALAIIQKDTFYMIIVITGILFTRILLVFQREAFCRLLVS